MIITYHHESTSLVLVLQKPGFGYMHTEGIAPLSLAMELLYCTCMAEGLTSEPGYGSILYMHTKGLTSEPIYTVHAQRRPHL